MSHPVEEVITEDTFTNRPVEKGIKGWEVAEQHEATSLMMRMSIGRREIQASLIGAIVLGIVFLLGCWLAGNPFENTVRIGSDAVIARGWDQNANGWGIIWSVVFLAVVFEFLDASAGMGYGTAFTPLLIIMGFDPMQIVPVIMIQQACASLTSSYIHREYGNVEWQFRPMSETFKLCLIIAITGSLAVIFSITSVYAILKLASVWVKLYVCVLLLGMGVISVIHLRGTKAYRPKRMLFFGALAGFNKGIGGGGYGPVLTIGGMMSGVPVKSMIAVTALSEGVVCVVSLWVWLFLLNAGVQLDFILLPSMMLGSAVAVLAAPYAVRVLPEKKWKIIVPIYCCTIAVISFVKLAPSLF